MGRNTPKPNRADRTAADQKLIDGINKHMAALPSFIVGGASQTPANVIAILQARIATANAVTPAHAAWADAVAADKGERTKTKAYVSSIRQALLLAFAGQANMLADFGLTGRKPAVRTPEAKIASAAKAKATRAARHTMGKNQKRSISGDVTGVTVTPVTAPQASQTAPAPAPALTQAPHG